MSENYKLYQRQMERRRASHRNRPLSIQLSEILEFVRTCESRWPSEERPGLG
ncbi:MAG TPA: hypothetical protein VJQ08_04715 [Candidatus Dormibacteraeota bacterium]|nr:hypothetical protein [Candidatus Dormibacteraeota bacterium]